MAKVLIMRILMGFAATAMLLDLVAAVDYTVGAPNGGWDQSTDLQSWATSQTFSVGDNIGNEFIVYNTLPGGWWLPPPDAAPLNIFQFSSNHDVLEVSKSDYDSCATGSPVSSTNRSPTRVALTTAGSRYFICSISNHCSQGMKVQIDTVASSSATPPQATTPSAPSPPTDGPTSNSPPPPATGETVDPPSSAMTLKMTACSVLGFGFLVMMLLSL